MKRALPLLCAAALLAASCTSEKKTDDTGRVIVLGIDGGTWTVIEPMMEAGELPNLRKLYDSGLHGVLESRPPILSPVVWTTIFSGFGYQKHGIKDWKTSQSVNRKVNGIWEILRDENKRVDVFNVPATWPPDPIPGVMLSGFPLSGATFGGNTGVVLTREELDTGKKVATAYKDSLDAIRQNVASLEIGAWSGWFDAKVSTRPNFRGTLRAKRLGEGEYYLTPVYRVDDGLIISEPKKMRSEVAKTIGEPYIPEGPGWSKWAEAYTPEVLYEHLDQVFRIQSKAAREYASGDWKLFLYVMTLVDRVSHPYWAYANPETFPTLDAEKARKYSAAVANSYRSTDEELGKILANIKGPAPYVVIVSDHGFQSNVDKSKPIGTHNPDGIYLISGPGITPKTGLPKFIEDVTPTLLYLMGMPTGRDMDGKVFIEVIDMLGRRPDTVPTYEKVQRDSTDEPVDADTWESLRGLGYVDGAPPRAADKKAAEQPKRDGATPGKPGVRAPGAKPGDATVPGAKPGGAMAPGAKPGAAGTRQNRPGADAAGTRQPGAKAPAATPGAEAPDDGDAPDPHAGHGHEAPPTDVLEDWPDAAPAEKKAE